MRTVPTLSPDGGMGSSRHMPLLYDGEGAYDVTPAHRDFPARNFSKNIYSGF